MRSTNGEAMVWRRTGRTVRPPRSAAPFDPTRIIVATSVSKGDHWVVPRPISWSRCARHALRARLSFRSFPRKRDPSLACRFSVPAYRLTLYTSAKTQAAVAGSRRRSRVEQIGRRPRRCVDQGRIMYDILVSASLRDQLFVLAAALVLVATALSAAAYPGRRVSGPEPPDRDAPRPRPSGLAPRRSSSIVTCPDRARDERRAGVVRGALDVRRRPLDGLLSSSTGAPTSSATAARVRAPAIREQLPRGLDPHMGPITSIMGEIMLVALTADGTRLADGGARDRRLHHPPAASRRCSGVAQVIAIGGEVRQYRVTPSIAHHAGARGHARGDRAGDHAFGTNTGGGFVDQGGREYLIRNVGLTQSARRPRQHGRHLSQQSAGAAEAGCDRRVRGPRQARRCRLPG